MDKARDKKRRQGKTNIADLAGHTNALTSMSGESIEISKRRQQHGAAWTIDIGQTAVAESRKGRADGEAGTKQSSGGIVPKPWVDIDGHS